MAHVLSTEATPTKIPPGFLLAPLLGAPVGTEDEPKATDSEEAKQAEHLVVRHVQELVARGLRETQLTLVEICDKMHIPSEDLPTSG